MEEARCKKTTYHMTAFTGMQMYRDGKQISGTWGWVREWGQTVMERGEVFGNGNVQKLDCG